ncbi:MAG: sugar nucleotide-binding protein [Planctomycetota bacterium]
MRTVLVLGATGLLGHQVMRVLARRFRVIGTTQRDEIPRREFLSLDRRSFRYRIRAEEFETIRQVVSEVEPVVVVNCIGVVKNRFDEIPISLAEVVNGVFPLQLSELCEQCRIRLIHISTDCVYSGQRGNYSETDQPDPIDAYGRTKLRGEPNASGCLILRTSFIGRELDTRNGLVEWLRSQQGGRVPGYTQARFSGLTTAVLARLIDELIEQYPNLRGIWHVAGDSIDKCSLLRLVNKELRLNVTIVPVDTVVCDRSLDGAAFRIQTGFLAPSWPEMVAELAIDSKLYD